MLHNTYAIAGGEDQSTLAEATELRKAGVDVRLIQRHNRELATTSSLDHLSAGIGCIWSTDSYRIVRNHIREFRPNIVHCQNIFPQFSPSVYYACLAEKVPVVQHIRNYRLVCAAATLRRNNKPCELCVGNAGAAAIKHKCYRNSTLATSAVVASNSIHWLMGTWTQRVNGYIAVSNYVKSLLIRHGVAKQSIFVKPNVCQLVANVSKDKVGKYGLYVGRLSEEKGLKELLSIWTAVSEIPLKVIGTGPQESQLRSYALSQHLNVEFLGQLPNEDLASYYHEAAFTIVPSIWAEPFGRIIIESMQMATPVIATSVGGIPELIEDGVDGFLYNPKESHVLVNIIKHLWYDHVKQMECSKQARASFVKKFSAVQTTKLLIDIYSRVFSSAGAP